MNVQCKNNNTIHIDSRYKIHKYCDNNNQKNQYPDNWHSNCEFEVIER